MSELEQLLQERIERLENGEPLAVCLVGLPTAEARALRLIATIRAMAVEDAEAETVAEQRYMLLGAAATRLKPAAVPPPSTGPLFLVQLQGWLDWLLTRPELAGALAFVLLFALLGIGWLGLSRGQADNEDEGVIATLAEPTTVTIAEEAAPTSPMAETAETEVAEVAEEQATPLGESVPATAVAAPTTAAYTSYLPILSASLNLTAQTAAVQTVAGLVEVQGADGAWTAVNRTSTLTAGQRVRTGKLSQATLTFFDGSQAQLYANTEMSLDELNALRPEQGFRTVVMTQWLGESEHSVQFRNDGGSRYEVKTPTGSGLARGTKFQVLVMPDQLIRYIVTEGKVDVTGAGRTVSVTAGQLTTFVSGSVPAEPAFTITGEGEVAAIGPVWTIAGQSFQTHAHTLIIGNPQLGDLVQVDGHLLADGGRMADRIILLRRAVTNRFSLSGEVEAMGTTWTVAGQTILVNEQTVIDEDIVSGDQVRVDGIILPGGTLQAQIITRLAAAPGLPFRFTGVVQAINDDGWIVSGRAIAINEETAVEDGIVVGDIVVVRGWILEDDTWLARRIRLQTEELPTFEFTGAVQNMEPWQVAGIPFETRPWTIIAPGIQVGDAVRVRGVILSNGTWVAEAITPLADTLPNIVTFIGIVASIDPWVVNGLPLVVTADTVILGDITVGSPVIVQAQLLPDGTWTVLSIRPLYPDFGYGCLRFSSPVTAINADTIQVRHWNGHIGRANIQGDIKVNSVILLPLCTGWNGTIIIIGPIIIIYQPVIIIIDDGGGGLPPGCKISGGSRNPHVKCSNRGSRGS